MSSVRTFMTAVASVVALGMLQACTTLRVGSDFDHGAAFSGYHSFALMQREHHGSRNPLVVQRARDAIEQGLARKGYAYVTDPGTADFIVDFTIGARDRMDIQSYPSPYTDRILWGSPGWWGPYWGSAVDVHTYREGTLSVDVFDGRTHKPVWHGWAKKELSRSDTEQSEAPIRGAVDAVLAQFPPH